MMIVYFFVKAPIFRPYGAGGPIAIMAARKPWPPEVALEPKPWCTNNSRTDSHHSNDDNDKDGIDSLLVCLPGCMCLIAGSFPTAKYTDCLPAGNVWVWQRLRLQRLERGCAEDADAHAGADGRGPKEGREGASNFRPFVPIS